MQEKHEQAIAQAARTYQRATEAQKAASAKLIETVRAAYADGEQQSAILKAAGHVWSREYLRIVLGLSSRRKGGAE